MTPATIQISTPFGKDIREGFATGGLGLHSGRLKSGGIGWIITHLASGRYIEAYRLRPTAEQCLKGLLALGDWARPDAKEFISRADIERVCDHHRT